MADSDKPYRPYEVGRGKPPKKTQFKKGQSGNPRGRRKGSKNFKSTLQTELKRQVTINEDGRRKRISKREAVAKQLVNKAVSGDPKALPVLLREALSYETDSEDGSTGPRNFPTTAEDDLVLENIIKRIRESTMVQAALSKDVAAAPEPPPSESEDKGDDAHEIANKDGDDADQPS